MSERDAQDDVLICGGAAEEFDLSLPGGFVWWTASTPTMGAITLSGTAFHGADFNSGALQLALPPELAGAMTSTTAPVIVELRDVNALGWMVGTIAGPGHPEAQAALILPAPLQSDLNNDGFVDSQDLSVLLGAWGACDLGGYCLGDLDGSGTVGSADFAFLLNEWAPLGSAGDPPANSIALVCQRLSCRGSASGERTLAPVIAEIFARYGCCDSYDFGCFLADLPAEPCSAVMIQIRDELEAQ